MSEQITAINVTDLSVIFKHRGAFVFARQKPFKALSNISFTVAPGECLGIVGESGSGKTTLARSILGMIEPSAGQVHFQEGLDQRQDIQFIFQDPLAALNPRMTVEQLVTEPLDYLASKLDSKTRTEKLRKIMEQVGLDYSQRQRYAHEFSGGQCQRIGIARAMITEPKILICDEPVSALDVSVRAQVINLLKDFQQRLNLTLIFIAHDLSLVRFISDRILVLYQGKLMETGTAESIFTQPRHPYTQALINAEPRPDPQLERQRKTMGFGEADFSGPAEPNTCVFASRCAYAQAQCHQQTPELHPIDAAGQVACLFPLDVLTTV